MLTPKKYIKKVIVNDKASTAEARSERLRRIRNMANLSREKICNSKSLNINTYKGWEIARYGGLPVDGADKVIARVAREGVICTAEWLLHGIGVGPYIVPEYQKSTHAPLSSNLNVDPEQHTLLNEIQLFKSHFSDAIVYTVEDDGLASYQPGEIVAGIPRYQERIQDLIGENCIVQTETGLVLARQLKQSETPGKYTLVCTNLQTNAKKPMLYDVTLISAAPIIRHYRRNP